jgi:hypothetical protein
MGSFATGNQHLAGYSAFIPHILDAIFIGRHVTSKTVH